MVLAPTQDVVTFRSGPDEMRARHTVELTIITRQQGTIVNDQRLGVVRRCDPRGHAMIARPIVAQRITIHPQERRANVPRRVMTRRRDRIDLTEANVRRGMTVLRNHHRLRVLNLLGTSHRNVMRRRRHATIHRRDTSHRNDMNHRATIRRHAVTRRRAMIRRRATIRRRVMIHRREVSPRRATIHRLLNRTGQIGRLRTINDLQRGRTKPHVQRQG